MGTTFKVEVDADQFDRLARITQPLAGVEELIWNALDAEADAVTVVIHRTDLSAIESVVVTDNGHGMTNLEAFHSFERLGGSWKKFRALSQNNKRSLHGKQGEGRFRAFALGHTAVWTTVARAAEGHLERTCITGTVDSSEFTVSDPEPLATGEPGTEVRVSRPRKRASPLLGEGATNWLVSRFAVYLIKYRDVAISYDGRALDPQSIIRSETEIVLDHGLAGHHDPPVLRIIEWKPSPSPITSSLLLCDENGVTLREVTERIESDGEIRFTAYLTWGGFSELANYLVLADMDPRLSPVLDAARNAIRNYLNQRLVEQQAEIVDRWKTEKVYPYTDPPTTLVEVQERQLFDAVAVTAASAVGKEPRAAKFSLRLIKEALGQPPGALHRVLREVLDLTPEQLADLDRLLERTTLASIIHTSKIIISRLEFLCDLENMLFDVDSKERLLERTELHRILANGQTWVFGEDYMLAVSDQGLTKVLQAHLKLLGRNPTVNEPVRDTDGHIRIVDLMLSRAGFFAERRQHLVVELKRPNVVLTHAELAQITNYAIAVASDERFKSPDVNWDFWLVGDDLDPIVTALVHKKDQPAGLYTEGDNYKVWVRPWAELLEENRQRLHFYRKHLEYKPAEESTGLEDALGHYLPSAEEMAEASPTTT